LNTFNTFFSIKIAALHMHFKKKNTVPLRMNLYDFISSDEKGKTTIDEHSSKYIHIHGN